MKKKKGEWRRKEVPFKGRGTWSWTVELKKKKKRANEGSVSRGLLLLFILLNRQRERNKRTRKAGRGFMSCHRAMVCSWSRTVGGVCGELLRVWPRGLLK